MSTTTMHTWGTVSRRRFMIGVTSGLGAVIALLYLGVIVRYMYPKNAGATPPLKLKLRADGITEPQSGSYHAFQNGVAGPIFYPLSEDKSSVVGVFVEKKDAGGPLTAENLRVPEQTCTHLGCPVPWVPRDNQFECPCHGSVFRRDLSVKHGPAATPLMEHKFTLEGDTLTIHERKA